MLACMPDSAPIGGFPLVTPGFPGTAVFPLVGQTPTFHPNGGVFGLLAGQNFIVQSPFLIGWEADVTFGKKTSTTGGGVSTSISIPSFIFCSSCGGTSFGVVGANSVSATIDWSASLRARLGYVIDSWLLYGTFGGSLQRVTLSGFSGFAGAGSSEICVFTTDGFCSISFPGNFATSSTSSFSLTKTLLGAVVGVGGERLIGRNLTLRVEYLAAFYGRVNFGDVVVNSFYSDNFNCNCTVNSSVLGTVSANVTTQTLRVGLAAKFP
jgi:opacity protein-like surface antigen